MGISAAGSRGDAMRMLGPILIAERRSRWATYRAARDAERLDAVALCLSSQPSQAHDPRRCAVPRGPTSARLLELADDREPCGSEPEDGLVLLLPRRLVSPLLPGRFASGVVPDSIALTMLHRLAAGLLASDARFGEAQARLAGRALGELLVVALSPHPAALGMAPRREASLLDRVIAHVDAHLGDDLDTAALCAALCCSRSALYRAASPLGGVAVLVNHRRLAAVLDRLRDPGDRRSIAAVARLYGFADPARFSRSFKRRYGVTAAALRRAHATEPTQGVA